jgi:hypothetical protein
VATGWWRPLGTGTLAGMRFNPFSSLFAPSRRDQYLAEYVIREHGRGRALEDVLADPYVRNRTTPEQRARLLDRPDLVEAIGDHTVDELKRSLAGAPS